jgi:F-type H+-transporting ATPase subunit gamma
MTDTTASLRHRIDGAAELKTVVRTMKAQAAAAITQYERSVIALADYQRVVELGLSATLRDMEIATVLPDATGTRQVSGIGAVVFGSDQGLVGRFNDVIADHAVATLAAGSRVARVWGVGARVQARLAESGFTMSGAFAVPGTVAAITSLVGRILLQTEVMRTREPNSELYLIYNRPTTAAMYTPVSQRLLPLDASWRRRMLEQHWPKGSLPEVLGTTTTTLQALIGEYLFVSLFRAAAESLASENASRLSAMQRAEKSIDERLTDLNATFHRLRQSSIDEELFDVISGFEALSK